MVALSDGYQAPRDECLESLVACWDESPSLVVVLVCRAECRDWAERLAAMEWGQRWDVSMGGVECWAERSDWVESMGD